MPSMTIRISDELNDRLKARVAKNGTSISAFVLEWLTSALDGEDDCDRTDWAALGNHKMAEEVTTRFKRSAAKAAK